jgi:hypothetical protein
MFSMADLFLDCSTFAVSPSRSRLARLEIFDLEGIAEIRYNENQP